MLASDERSTCDLLYLYKGGRSQRLEGPDSYPTEFFYGFVELKAADKSVGYFEEATLDPLLKWLRPLLRRILARIFPRLPADLLLALDLARPSVLGKLNRARNLVATTQSLGFSICLLRALGILKAQPAFIVMGTFPTGLHPRTSWLIRRLLSTAVVLPISTSEAQLLSRELSPGADIRYLPFGVDTGFWRPQEPAPALEGGYVLAIGNDKNRDFDLLARAWRPEYPELRIVTSLPVAANGENVTIIRGDWRTKALSDMQILELYRGARFVVLPLKETRQPAGQSACLQAMACGKAVVISAISGLWDPALLRDGETCMLVEPQSQESLRRGIQTLLDDPQLAGRLGRAASAHVSRHCDVKATAKALEGFFLS